MKIGALNLFIISLIIGLAFSFTSCKKEYTCECTAKFTNNNNTQKETSTAEHDFYNENNAEDWCNEDAVESSSGPNTTINCTLRENN